jgi:hypothetical protein
MRRATAVTTAAALLASLVAVSVLVSAPSARSSPVAKKRSQYETYGRIFPDPHGCTNGAPGTSPFAKGDVCAIDFIQYEEMEYGLNFLDEKFPRFVENYVLSQDFNCRGRRVHDPSNGCKEWKSAGLPVTPDENADTFVRERRRLHMVRITDESVPNDGKKYFVFPLSIHGIERAGVEGGLRAAEDLATWGACEAGVAPAMVDCSHADNEAPHPLLEATPEQSVTAGSALRRSVVYFIMPNPDGWLRGDRFRNHTPGVQFYQRYNGNGVDLNRDWPEQGYTFRPYTPWSEPETRSFGRLLQAIGPKDANGDPKWTGGIDLHGQLIDRAFSFTLIGGSQRPYGKNQRVLQTVKGAWSDAEQRLAWSPIIKPNDAPEADPRVYGVQWGTIWDTIDYTVTGALGNWIDSPIGLNADGIDNEMSMSHVINCGIGTCWDPDVEQLHVDGNKSLVYSMINYSLKPEDTTFGTEGRVAYVHNDGVVKEQTNRFARPPRFARLDPQGDINNARLNPTNEYTYPFRVKGPSDGVYNGGIGVTITCDVSPVGSCSLSEAVLQRKENREGDPQNEPGNWETVNSYFNQSSIYLQTGQALHANLPIPGRWRVKIQGPATGVYDADINFTREKGWPDPGQIGYHVTNMKFWRMLQRFAEPGIERITAGQIENRTGWKRRYDTVVITNKVYPGLARELKQWVGRNDGNLVLTDKALGMLPEMGMTDGGIDSGRYYAGYVNFATHSDDETYDHYLARRIDQPGAAEGQTCGLTDPDPCTEEDEVHRHQTYEPVPLGIAIQNKDGDDAFHSPVFYVKSNKLEASTGRATAVGTTGDKNNVSYGEIKYAGGHIRFIGALLPMPTEKFDHPFGLASYALTYSGYQLLENSLTYTK